MNNFFTRYQKLLLFIANRKYLRWLLGMNRLHQSIKKEIAGKKIEKITGNALFYKTGKMVKVQRKGFRPQMEEEWQMFAFTRPRFAEALAYNLSPVTRLVTREKKTIWRLSPIGFAYLFLFGLFSKLLNIPIFLFFSTTTSYYTGAGDGTVGYTGSASWATTHDTLDGTTACPSLTDDQAAAANCVANGNFIIWRDFLPADTSGLPDDATIGAASVNIYLSVLRDTDTSDIRIVQTSQASTDTLAVGDYDACGDAITNPTTYGTKTLANLVNSQYNAIDFSSFTIISKTGISMIGLRIGRDCTNSAPPAASHFNDVGHAWSEYAGTDRDPYLSVTYTDTTTGFEKNVIMKVYDDSGNYLKTWADAEFVGFSKEINGGLGECQIRLARKFDDYGEYFDVKLNNEVQILITDRDTYGQNDAQKRIYGGYISKYEPFIEGGAEGVLVTLLGYYTRFAQDIYKNNTTTTITETGADVGLMFRNLMNRYAAENSNNRLTYNSGSIQLTSTTATYTFEMATYREAIEVIKSLAPADWWWYVDQDNIVHFKSKPTTASHKFIFKRHFTSLRVEKNMEKLKNAMLFWNSLPTGSGRIYKLYTDDGSVDDYGRRVVKIVDQARVGSTVDADKIGDAFVSEHKEPDIKVMVEIIDNNYDSAYGYDIESIEPGDTCVFLGFSDALDETFKENMVITKVEYTLDKVRLTIEPMLASIVDRIEQVARQVNDLNTKDAPISYSV